MERGPLGAGIINLSNVSQPVFGLKAKQIKGLFWWVFLYWVRRLLGGGGEEDTWTETSQRTDLKLRKLNTDSSAVNSQDYCCKCVV